MTSASNTAPRAHTNGVAPEVLDFWRAAGPQKWFAKDVAFDEEFASRFAEAHYHAAACEYVHWLDEADSALALILLLDQYPRNAFRGTGHMFATDGLALRYARRALAAGFLQRLEPALRNFMCLPFMHAEDRDVQKEALALYKQHVPDSIHWAVDHHDIIHRFGRFPHRNAALGRESTDEERRFLDEGGFAG